MENNNGLDSKNFMLTCQHLPLFLNSKSSLSDILFGSTGDDSKSGVQTFAKWKKSIENNVCVNIIE